MPRVIVPLTELTGGLEGRIVELKGGFGFQRKVRVMGFREGKKVRVISVQPAGGPLTIEIGGSRITIGRGMAERIFVEVE